MKIKATSIPLSTNIVFKNKRISELEAQRIIHNEKVFKIAKQIIVPIKSDKLQIKRKKAFYLILIIERVWIQFC